MPAQYDDDLPDVGVPHFERGLFQVRETRERVDGWDTERGVELWYGNFQDVDGRILLGLRWSAGRGWCMSTDFDTREVAMPTEEAPHMAEALEMMARVVRTL